MNNRAKITLAAGVAGLALGIGLAGILSLQSSDDPEAVVDAYLVALRDHENTAVADLTCDARQGEEPLRAISVAGEPEVEVWDIVGSEERDEHAKVNAKVTITLFRNETDDYDLTFELVDEGGWHVCGVTD